MNNESLDLDILDSRTVSAVARLILEGEPAIDRIIEALTDHEQSWSNQEICLDLIICFGEPAFKKLADYIAINETIGNTETVARTITSWQDERALKPLRKLYKLGDLVTQHTIIEMLDGLINFSGIKLDESTIRFLVELLQDRLDDYILAVLECTTDYSLDILYEYLYHANPWIRLGVIQLIRPNPIPRETYLELLDTNDVEVKLETIRKMGGLVDMMPVLIDIVQNKNLDEMIRGRAIYTLGTIPQSFDFLYALTENEDYKEFLRWVKNALGKQKNPKSLPFFEKLILNPHPIMIEQIEQKPWFKNSSLNAHAVLLEDMIRTIAGFKSEDIMPLMQILAQSEYPNVRELATNFLNTRSTDNE